MRAPNIKTSGIVTWVCVLSSMVLFLTLFAFAVHVRLGLGHWPTPMIEKYHTAWSSFHEMTIVVLGYFCVLAGPPIWLATSFWSRSMGSARFGKQLLVYLAGWALILLAGYCDPTTFTAWLLD